MDILAFGKRGDCYMFQKKVKAVEMHDPELMVVYDLFGSFSHFEEFGLLPRIINQYEFYSQYLKSVCIQTWDSTNYENFLPNNIKHITFSDIPIKKLFYFFLSGIMNCLKYSPNYVEVTHITGILPAIPYKLFKKSKLILVFNWDFAHFVKELKGTSMGYVANLLQLFALKTADLILASTPSLVKEASIHVPYSKIILLPNYVDTNLFAPNNSVNRVTKRLIFVGRLHPQKNLYMLLDVMKQLPEFSLQIVGDGPLHKDLIGIKNMYNIHNVDFLGAVPHTELPKYLNQSDAFIFTTNIEGHPKALIEAMSCGLPCIGSNVEGIRGIISDGETGVLCDRSVESIKNCIDTLFKNKLLMDMLGKNARAYVIDNFSQEVILNKKIRYLTGRDWDDNSRNAKPLDKDEIRMSSSEIQKR
jgi:glycosyltransferase involved in cell wall biosynthesis